MKKRIIALGIVLALAAVLVVPMAVSADTVVTGDVGQTPTVTGIDPAAGLYSASPIAVTITGTGFIQDSEEASSVTFSGTGVTAVITDVVSATSITAGVTITAGALQGARDVSVTVAGKTGTSATALFTVTSYITVNAPANFSLGLMTVGVAKEVASGTPGTSASNYSTWTVTAKDANVTPSTKGYMLLNVSPFTPLTNKLLIGKATGPTAVADTGFSYDANATSLPLYASQTVAVGDSAGTYTITITFTSSGS